jgi:hypothetical protein
VGSYFDFCYNQTKANFQNLIEALSALDMGLVYNFHHAHDQIERFTGLADKMLANLWYVNLNGMKKQGPRILTIGEGNHEQAMISILESKGYTGDYGVLGHVEDADAREIQEANLEGLRNFSVDK